MENNKKFNKLSVVSFILIIVGTFLLPLLAILENLNIYILNTNNWVWYTISVSLVVGLILAIVSLFKIKKSGEKGRVFAISTIVIFIILVIIVLYSFLTSSGDPKSPSAAIKSNMAAMRAQAEMIYDSSTPKSYQSVCGENLPLLNHLEQEYKIKTKCFSDSDSYVVSAELFFTSKKDSSYANDTYFCVDSLGSTQSITTLQNNSIINADTLCPQPEKQKEIPNGISCKQDSDCFCDRFDGENFLPGKGQGSCNLSKNICNTCIYR